MCEIIGLCGQTQSARRLGTREPVSKAPHIVDGTTRNSMTVKSHRHEHCQEEKTLSFDDI
jgi:hypothetical protein